MVPVTNLEGKICDQKVLIHYTTQPDDSNKSFSLTYYVTVSVAAMLTEICQTGNDTEHLRDDLRVTPKVFEDPTQVSYYPYGYHVVLILVTVPAQKQSLL